MVRSFISRFGKWILLAAIVGALALWFISSNSTENYADKYEGYDLTVSTEGIGRDNTYELYLSGSIISADLSHGEFTGDAAYYTSGSPLILAEDGRVLTAADLPEDAAATKLEDGTAFTRYSGVLAARAGSSVTLKVTVPVGGLYTLTFANDSFWRNAVDMADVTINGAAPVAQTAEDVDGETVTYYRFATGENTIAVSFTADTSLEGVRLQGPIRNDAAGENIPVDLAAVTAAEGVSYHETLGVTEDGQILTGAHLDKAIAEGKAYTEVKNAVLTESGSSAAWKVSVPADGYYYIQLSYYTGASRGVDLEREILINGELPFDGADTMTFSRLWTDGGEIRTDNQGNQIRPTQAEIYGIPQTAWCRDAMGYITEPYRFFLEEGENTITLNAVSEPMVLTAMTLCPPAERQSYAEYLAGIGDKAQPESLKGYSQTIEGETAQRRSSPSLYARYDRSSPATVPYDVTRTVLNYIGGDAWRDAGQWIEWDFTVPEDGWYNITVKGRQTYSRGSVSSRIVYVDGEVLFSEMENLAFPYSASWQMNTLTADGQACRIYLEKDKTHTIRLEATLGDMGPILSDIEESIYRLNGMYRKILVLTGVTPDPYRDYHLEDKYPEVIDEMEKESRRLYKLVDDTVAVTGQKSDRVAVAQTLAVQLELFAEDPAEITQAFTNFKDNITSLGTAMLNLRQVQLDVDQIYITADGVTPEAPRENFFSKAWHEIKSCVASYTVDYNALGDVHEGDDVLEVWILTGRDQSTVLKTMVDDTFTAKYGIPVNVMLVDPNALLNATVAGNGPDVVVSTDSWNPVNYALRGAAEDLTQFEGYEEVLAQFYPSAYQAFKFTDETGHEGVYALPETQLCSIMFYRKDILEEYNLPLPRTWEDLIAMLPTLQGANMSVGIPYPDIVAPNLSCFYAMVYQRGGTIYSDDATMTTLNSEAAVKAFETYTSLYNDYGLPTIFDFVSRFRSGEMPIGIFDYTTFNTLNVSAPEIRGLWDIAVLPGTVRTAKAGEEYIDENGDRHIAEVDTEYIDYSGHSQGACCMMIATDDEEMKQKAWQFMKWWVSTDAQVRFGREIESILGPSSRYATANIEAINQLAWSEEQLDVIEKQMKVAIGFREVAGGYYTTRHLTNAVRKVTNEKTDPRETLLDYARTINEEIVKKRNEFGLPVPQEAIEATKNSTPTD